MITTIIAVIVARSANPTLGTAAKFANSQDQRVFQHTPFVQISNQGRKSCIEHRCRLSFHPFTQALMDIPGVVIGVGNLGPDHFNYSRTGFYQSASQQAALTKSVASITIPHLFRFPVDGESITGSTGNDQVERLLVILIELVIGGCFFDLRHSLVDQVSQPCTTSDSTGVDMRLQFEIINADLVHFLHIHIATRRIEIVRIKCASQESRGATLANDVAFLQRSWQHDKGKHG